MQSFFTVLPFRCTAPLLYSFDPLALEAATVIKDSSMGYLSLSSFVSVWFAAFMVYGTHALSCIASLFRFCSSPHPPSQHDDFIGQQLVAIRSKSDHSSFISVYCRRDFDMNHFSGCAAQSRWDLSLHRVEAWYARKLLERFDAWHQAWTEKNETGSTFKLLLLGIGGGGMIDQLLHDPTYSHVHITAVDIEPEAIAISTHFVARASDRLTYVEADAFQWVCNNHRVFHCVINDVFELLAESDAGVDQSYSPSASLELQFLTSVRRCIREDGCYLHATLGPRSCQPHSLSALSASFVCMKMWCRSQSSTVDDVTSFVFECSELSLLKAQNGQVRLIRPPLNRR
jgi:hypothetical protein